MTRPEPHVDGVAVVVAMTALVVVETTTAVAEKTVRADAATEGVGAVVATMEATGRGEAEVAMGVVVGVGVAVPRRTPPTKTRSTSLPTSMRPP